MSYLFRLELSKRTYMYKILKEKKSIRSVLKLEHHFIGRRVVELYHNLTNSKTSALDDLYARSIRVIIYLTFEFLMLFDNVMQTNPRLSLVFDCVSPKHLPIKDHCTAFKHTCPTQIFEQQ